MSKVLILGASPLPFERSRKLYAMNKRTWQIVKPLIEDGNSICLCGARVPADAYYEEDLKEDIRLVDERENFIYYSIEWSKFKEATAIQKIHDKFRPDCIIGIGTSIAYTATVIKTDAPIWVDMNGYLLTEAQTRDAIYEDEGYIHRCIELEKRVIEKADAFSSVSTPQRFAIIGELALMGRLNRYTLGYEFVHVIPNGIESKEFIPRKKVIRGRYVEEEDFVILWIGGYNTWMDVETLFEGVSLAMKRNDKIKYVSLGGKIKGWNEISFEKFLEMVKSSSLQERFIFLGWVPTEELYYYYLEADIGINIDKFHYETLLGARTRINEMLTVGLPVVTSQGTEISYMIKEKNLGLTFPIGDKKALSEAILKLAEDKELLKFYGQRGKEFAYEYLTFEMVTLPLRKWVRNPKPSPDHVKKT